MNPLAFIMEYVEKEEPEVSSDSEEEEQVKKDWDIESIASTYTNTDNRPKVLAEDIPNPRKKSKVIKKIEETSIKQKETEEKITKSLKEMTKEEKSAYKKEVKAKQKERRLIKKTLKAAFKVFYYTQT